MRNIKSYHVHHSTATDGRWRGHSKVVNLKQNAHSLTHSYPLSICQAQHLSRKKEHTITPSRTLFYVTQVVRVTLLKKLFIINSVILGVLKITLELRKTVNLGNTLLIKIEKYETGNN